MAQSGADSGGRGYRLTEKVVSWHLLEDTLGCIAVLIGAVMMSFWDLLERSRPVEAFETVVQALPDVIAVRNAHSWSIDGESHVLTAHVVVRRRPVSTRRQRSRRVPSN